MRNKLLFLRTYLAYGFIALFMSLVFSQALVWGQFKLFQDYIAQELCVEKEKPNNCCQGSCFLEDQMEKQERQKEANFPIEQVQLYYVAPLGVALKLPKRVLYYITSSTWYKPHFFQSLYQDTPHHPPNLKAVLHSF